MAKPYGADLDVRLILRIMGLLVAGLIVAAAALWGLFRVLSEGPPLTEPVPIPKPRLQVAPARELEALRAAEDAVLNSYGWVDREAGIVRVPIERAMELLVERERHKAEGGNP